jgi:hypothetical protein
MPKLRFSSLIRLGRLHVRSNESSQYSWKLLCRLLQYLPKDSLALRQPFFHQLKSRLNIARAVFHIILRAPG